MAQVKKYHPTYKVYTGPLDLFDAFNGVKNKKGTAMIKPLIDPDGNPIIGKQIFDDPDWIGEGFTHFNGVPIIELLTEIPFCYYEETD